MSATKPERVKQLWKALADHGIHTEAQLNEAMKELKPLDISCMVSPIKKSEEVLSEK